MSDEPKRSIASWMRTRASVVLILCGLGATLASLLGFAGALWWPLDLASHFRVQYAAGLLVVGIGLLLLRRWKIALPALAFAVLNGAVVVPLYSAPEPVAVAGPRCRVLLMNLNVGNRNHQAVTELVATVDPDIVVLLEVSDGWLDAMTVIEPTLPRRLAMPRHDGFGIALYSRVPVIEGRLEYLADSGVPTIIAEMEAGDASFTLIATHPLSPVGRRRSGLRNRHLAALPAIVHEGEGPVVLVGDLNTTPWSPHFRSLIDESGLRNGARGHGLQASWPVDRPPMRIPIDHCLHSPDVVIEDMRLGPDVGSDHLPVVVDLRLP